MARVLVACESSGTVRDAFRKLGHDAWSCDLLPADPCTDDTYHMQCDVLDPLIYNDWDLVIAHPPCTYLTCSAEWAYADKPMIKGKPRNIKPGTLIGAARRKARDEAAQFFMMFTKLDCRWAIENPVGCMSSRYRQPDQIIQPYDYGEDASKSTGLWLSGLPLLQSTSYFEPRIVTINGKEYKRWSNQTDSGQNRLPPTKDRWQIRSKTYQGIADAMANQWSKVL